MDLFSQTPRAAAIDMLHGRTALYTREGVVNELLDMLDWPNGGKRLADTACGDGAFLVRAMERLLQRRPEASDDEIEGTLEGWEIHPFAASEARANLCSILMRHGRQRDRAQRVASAVVNEGDFLLDRPTDPPIDAMAGNPPYLRFAHVPEPLRSEYEEAMPDYARADLLHSFLDRCFDLLTPQGEIALVTADRWLMNESAAKLRERLGSGLGIAHLQRLDSASTFYRPKLRRKGTPPRVHPVAVVLRRPGLSEHPLNRQPIYPDAMGGSPQTGMVLGDVATVRLAPWLGTPGIFVVDEATARTLPASSLVPAIDTDDIVDGVLRTPTRYAILTSRRQEPCDEVLRHLDRTLPSMCRRGQRSPRWLPPESFEAFDLSQPALLVPRIARALRPVRIPPGILPVNHNLSIVASGSWTLDRIEAALRRPEAMAWVQARAPRLEHAYHSLTTRTLRQLPVQ